jgi:enterochelin esterase-like enzyme
MKMKAMIKKTAIILILIITITLSSACRTKPSTPVLTQSGKTFASGAVSQSSDTEGAVMQIDSDVKLGGYEKLTVSSKILGKKMRINIHLPPGYDKSGHYPVLYLFHGYGADEDAWFPDMGLEKTADKLIDEHKIKPVIIVSPEIDNSFGINSLPFYAHLTDNGDEIDMGMYENYICKELVPFIDKEYSTIPDRTGRSIGGFSMGGFIALHTAFLHSGMFSRVGGNSPALWTSDNMPGYARQFLYPTKQLQEARDPLLLAKSVTKSDGLSIYLDCGSGDDFQFYVGCAQLYNTLKANGVNVSYVENPGDHSLDYWEAHLTDYLLFYAGV